MINEKEIIEKAFEYLETPYHHQARLKGVGIDCAGLIICVLKELNIEVEDLKNYSRLPDSNLLQKICDDNCFKVPFQEARDGDILLITFIKNPQHLAFFYKENDENYMIHAYGENDVKKVIKHKINQKWLNKITCVYRLNIFK